MSHPSNIPPTCKKSLQIGLKLGFPQAFLLFLISGKNQTFCGEKLRFLCAVSSGWFHLIPPYSTSFGDNLSPQNPPLATAYRFESGHRHQTNIIRTRFSQWETGSDLLFSSRGLRRHISETVLSSDQNPSREVQEKRNKFRRTLLWKGKYYLNIPPFWSRVSGVREPPFR